jgi:hypothetical protein
MRVGSRNLLFAGIERPNEMDAARDDILGAICIYYELFTTGSSYDKYNSPL